MYFIYAESVIPICKNDNKISNIRSNSIPRRVYAVETAREMHVSDIVRRAVIMAHQEEDRPSVPDEDEPKFDKESS